MWKPLPIDREIKGKISLAIAEIKSSGTAPLILHRIVRAAKKHQGRRFGCIAVLRAPLRTTMHLQNSGYD